MFFNNYNLYFSGYWIDSNFGSLPQYSGVYCVYVCTYDFISNEVNLKRLIYIGEAQNINSRIATHEKKSAWDKLTSYGERICISTAEIQFDRNRIEAALINFHKPLLNIEYKNTFPFSDTSILTEGENVFLKNCFFVKSNYQRMYDFFGSINKSY